MSVDIASNGCWVLGTGCWVVTGDCLKASNGGADNIASKSLIGCCQPNIASYRLPRGRKLSRLVF